MGRCHHIVEAAAHFLIAVAHNAHLTFHQRHGATSIVGQLKHFQNIWIIVQKPWVLLKKCSYGFFLGINLLFFAHIRTRP